MISTLFLTLAFAALAAPSAQDAAPQQVLPPKTDVTVTLDAVIDEKQAKVGDPVSATLSKDIKDGGKVIVPKKSKLHGRITRMNRREIGFHNNSALKITWYEVGLLFDKIEAGGQQMPFQATLEEAGGKIFEDFFVPFSRSADKWGKWQRIQVSMTDIRNPDAGEGVIGVVINYMRVPKNFPMRWRTPD